MKPPLPKGAKTKMNYKSIIVSAILLISIFGFVAPAVPALASTGHAQIVIAKFPYLNSSGQQLYSVSNFVKVLGGTDKVVSSPPGYLAYNLTGVTFSGSQFFLYISLNGLSEICLGPNNPAGCTSADFQFAGPFNVADLSGSPKVLANGFSIGKLNATTIALEGPIPTNLSAGNYYVKFFDGTSTSVAVTAQYIQIVPNLMVSPTAGPAGATVTATGLGYSAGGKVNVTLDDCTNAYCSPSGPAGSKVFSSTLVTANSTGGWTYSFAAPDVSGVTATKALDFLNTTATLSPPAGTASASLFVDTNDTNTAQTSRASYSEYYREFLAVQSLDPSGVLHNPTSTTIYAGIYPNDTVVKGYVTEELGVVGNYFNPSQNATFMWDGASITPSHFTGINQTGYFVANFTVPIASLGKHFLTIVDASGNMSVYVNVQTTLIVSPSRGPEGTSVTVTGYGFSSSANVTVWWFGTTFVSSGINADQDNMLVIKTATNSQGFFTSPFSAPSNVYGGSHAIFANDSKQVNATASFYVTPSFSSSPSSAALGSSVSVVGTGLPVGNTTYTSHEFPLVNGLSTGAASSPYYLSYDNAFTLADILGNATGYASQMLTASGVPMVHYIGVWAVSSDDYTPFPLTPFANQLVVSLPLNVTGSTTEGAAIQSLLNSVLSNQNNEMTVLNNILSQSKANGAAIANVSSQVQGVSGQISSLSSSVSSLSQSVTSGFQSTSSSLSGISSTLSSVQSQTSQIPTVSGNLGNVSTYLIIAIVLAAIVLILEIIILVRKK